MPMRLVDVVLGLGRKQILLMRRGPAKIWKDWPGRKADRSTPRSNKFRLSLDARLRFDLRSAACDPNSFGPTGENRTQHSPAKERN